MLTIDGARGEGGGQVIRTSLALASMLKQAVRLENIRANRKNPGLAAQHLTAVRASAMICDAKVSGDTLGSTEFTFVPQSTPQAGVYEFDVAQARDGGSAGAATLVLQTILLPLAQATMSSEVTIRGGTHVAWSPSYHFIQDVYLPTVANLSIDAEVVLSKWGWYPAGGGEIKAKISGGIKPTSNTCRETRGQLQEVSGLAVASSLPAHIAQRMQNRATKLLNQAKVPAIIEPQRVRSVSPGAGLFLVAEYEHCRAGFSVLGKKGKTSEQVAEEAVQKFLKFHRSDAVLDEYLTDQLLLPLALNGQGCLLISETLSSHTLTNLWVIEQFLGPVAKVSHKNNSIEFFQRAS